MKYEVEDNNKRDNANNLNLNEIISGKISYDGDVDTYKIKLREGHVIFEFNIPSGKNYRIRVFKEGELYNPLTEFVSTDTAISNRTCEADVGANDVGFYYVCISFNPTNTTYSDTQYYTLKVIYSELSLLNYNQKYINNDTCIINGGCTACCIADIASYYEGTAVTLEDLKADGVYTQNNASVNWSKISYFHINAPITPNNLYSYVKNEINCGHPVLLHYTCSFAPNDGHWVVAYKYINNCTSDSDIYVCDPSFTNSGTDINYTGNPPFNQNRYNNGITISEAKADNSIETLTEVRSTSPN